MLQENGLKSEKLAYWNLDLVRTLGGLTTGPVGCSTCARRTQHICWGLVNIHLEPCYYVLNE